jgi:hypothetical protein
VHFRFRLSCVKLQFCECISAHEEPGKLQYSLFVGNLDSVYIVSHLLNSPSSNNIGPILVHIASILDQYFLSWSNITPIMANFSLLLGLLVTFKQFLKQFSTVHHE